jgi:GR25 family glycosyltransferase involved in LPS biosynthesis
MNDPDYSTTLTPEFKESCYEIIRENVGIYCLSFNHPRRTEEMRARFRAIGLNINVFEGVGTDDPRIADTETRKTDESTKRLWSVTYGHLTNIRTFYDSGKDYGLFCENDVLVNKNLPFFLPEIMGEFAVMGLDSLLMGYMTSWKLEDWMEGYCRKQGSEVFINRPYKYLNYPDHHWGIHGLLLGRKGAKLILDRLEGRADEWIDHESHFSPDWTITKMGNRALITPMFLVENGEDGMEHYGDWHQWQFHHATWSFNALPGVFV